MRVIHYRFPKTGLLFNKQLWGISNFRQLPLGQTLTQSMSETGVVGRMRGEGRRNRNHLLSEHTVTAEACDNSVFWAWPLASLIYTLLCMPLPVISWWSPPHGGYSSLHSAACLCVTLGTASPPSERRSYWVVLTFPHRASLWDRGLTSPRPLPQLCAFVCLPMVRMMGGGGKWGVTPCKKTKAKALVPDAKGTIQKRTMAGSTTRFLRKAPSAAQAPSMNIQYRMLVSHHKDCTYTDQLTSHAHQVRSFL